MSDFPLSLVLPAPPHWTLLSVSLFRSSWQLRLHHEAGRLGREGHVQASRTDQPC